MSTLPAWSESLSVGNEVLDEQHRQLIKFFNRVADFSAARSPEAVNHFYGLLSDGIRLVEEHFFKEEEILRTNQCPGLQLHCAEHNQYREKLAVLLKDGMAGNLRAPDIYGFAKNGLICHMRERDLLDKSFMKNDTVTVEKSIHVSYTEIMTNHVSLHD
jgi:hemerythrin